MKKLLLLAALLLPTTALAQNSCPGTSYLGWGYGCVQCDGGSGSAWTPIIVSFPNSAGSATLNVRLVTAVSPDYPTSNPETWNARDNAGNRKFYGTVSYNDGTISYTGAAEFYIEFAQATNVSNPCIPDKDYIPRFWMVSRLKIQSCTNGHVLTSRFYAVNMGGSGYGTESYCDTEVGPACTVSGSYVHENWMNLTVSGF